jgi:hypothetical protein
MEHAALPWENRADRVAKLKDGKGPVLWPGMDGLGINSAKRPATVTIRDDLSTSPKKAAEKRQSTPFSPVPPIPPVKKEN